MVYGRIQTIVDILIMPKQKAKNTSRWLLPLIFIVIMGVVRLFGGIYKDDEFQGKFFFIKNKPTWKWSFYAPRAMSDASLDEMSNEKKKEQLMYDQYVLNRIWEFPIPFLYE